MPAFRKLPPRHASIVVPFLLSLMMCGVVSAISTARALGLSADLPTQWLKGWGLSWLVAFPTLLVVMPLVRRLAGLLVESPASR
ncbi:DUF2798 domain-containing protein [Aureimonas ureilytica]|uniref:DUF2798 domain-containing protein n=1 Tax=Aureimonas ureilytica TaxID=401562 RepID=UPI00036FA1F5|nr:DUF2798 domain-containing protein [Aureimonas ureilytica]